MKIVHMDDEWARQVHEFLTQRPPRDPSGSMALVAWGAYEPEPDPSLERATSLRGLLRQMKAIVGYEYRKATGQLRDVPSPDVGWQLEGRVLWRCPPDPSKNSAKITPPINPMGPGPY